MRVKSRVVAIAAATDAMRHSYDRLLERAEAIGP
jgi:hypothetical protein